MLKKKYKTEEEKKTAMNAASVRYRKKNPTKMKEIYKRSNKKRSEKRKPYMKEYNKTYGSSEEGKKIKSEAMIKWKSNKENPKVVKWLENQKKASERYQKTEKGKIANQKYKKNYRQTENYRISQRESQKKYLYKRYHLDPTFKLRSVLRSRLRKWVKSKGISKPSITMELVGTNKEYLRNYLEKLFYNNPRTGEQMTWGNHGIQKRLGTERWHIDHIKPFDAIDSNSVKQIYEVMNYKNLQPMWAKENMKKGNKII